MSSTSRLCFQYLFSLLPSGYLKLCHLSMEYLLPLFKEHVCRLAWSKLHTRYDEKKIFILRTIMAIRDKQIKLVVQFLKSHGQG